MQAELDIPKLLGTTIIQLHGFNNLHDVMRLAKKFACKYNT